jgi:hypothetical protein
MIANGSGRINFRDQPLSGQGESAVHHLETEIGDLKALVQHMRGRGFVFRKPTHQGRGAWKHIMVKGPDGVLLELFQVAGRKIPEELYPRLSAS